MRQKKPTAVDKAMSFRLGTDHLKMLRELSEHTDRNQVVIIRRLIEAEYKREFKREDWGRIRSPI